MSAVETGWLIERQVAGRAHWWTGSYWSTESLDAIRYARQIDGTKTIAASPYFFVGADVTEHQWG